MTTFYSGLLGEVLDLLYPPVCALCKVRCSEKICPRCRGAFKYVEEPFCHLCGCPINPENPGCSYCALHSAPFDVARSVLIYEGALRDAVLKLKFEEKIQLAPLLSTYLQDFFDENRSLLDSDIMVPVPKGKTSGRINGAPLLVHYLKKTSGIPSEEALVREPIAPPQHSLDYKQRWLNAKAAFTVADDASVAGKSILLIDDIFTTGATVSGCSSKLLAAGARGVKVLTLARTPEKKEK